MNAQVHEKKLQCCVLCAPQLPVSKPQLKCDKVVGTKPELTLPAPPAAPIMTETAPTMAETVHNLVTTKGRAVTACADANAARFPAKLRDVVRDSQGNANTCSGKGTDTGVHTREGHMHAAKHNAVLQESYANHLQSLDAQAAKRLRNAVDEALSSHMEKWQDLEQQNSSAS